MKSFSGNYFEDFTIGRVLKHATPLTVNEADLAIYRSLTGSRYALYSSTPFAEAAGFDRQPIDPLIVFHVVFGKTVPDISLNAVANLGYADGKFLAPVFPGDTLFATSEVIGRKENSNGKTGVVYVRTTGTNQNGETVLTYVRWVMVNKKDASNPAPEAVLPDLPKVVPADQLSAGADYASYDTELAGSPHLFEDYEIGEQIDHVDGMTIEESEHQTATRLYQNTAKVHFNQFEQAKGRFGKRLIYGGVVISTARSLAFNGLANAGQMIAINGGTHCNPLFSGDTIHAWSEVLDKADLSDTVGALRLRLVATKDKPCADYPYKGEDGKYLPDVLLDFDYWAAVPKSR
ncbi:MaoC family dehydratase [Ponticaulis sp.]|uniref:MaoC family dehydratase n=1 Tax=Ponticaulis sp. TaxID=2020902 RepID=UPI000B716094|nr:MaoC family dehydratase [Ponticaulis sp.]MAI90268.1 hypothetical protein [Ponticaulis sp.]OUX99910.1 MAG: hypothetical protein CBB65_07490 [Hyphomonadaceae bacterium TMED5]|tara:strand:- start:247239 stop:248279 length:1041 start_codon:yes stop_codon:yes gene_type:complete